MTLDFATEPPMVGEDGCVVRAKASGGEGGEVVGYLPFPLHYTPLSVSTSRTFPSSTSLYPLPFHPLLAIHLLLSAHNVLSIDASTSPSPSSHSSSRATVDVTLFLHDKLLTTSRLRSNLLKQACTTLFRLFPQGKINDPEAPLYDPIVLPTSKLEQPQVQLDQSQEAASDEPMDASVQEEKTESSETGEVSDVFSLLSARRRRPAVDPSTVSISTPTPSLSAASARSPTSAPSPKPPVVVSQVKEKRRIVPTLVPEESKEGLLGLLPMDEELKKERPAVDAGKEEKKEVDMVDEEEEEEEEAGEDDSDEAEDEDGDDDEEEEEDVDEGEEGDDDSGGGEDGEGEEEEEEEEEDDFGLEQLDPAQHLRAYVDLQSMRAPPAPVDEALRAEVVDPPPSYSLTAEEEKEEKEQEEEGVRIEEAFTLDNPLDDPAISSASSISSSSSSSSSTRRSLLGDDLPSSSSSSSSPTSSLHSFAWQKHDLDTLYNALRPSSSWSLHPNPPLLSTSLLPFQRQALTWMLHRESAAPAFTYQHPLYDYTTLHALPAYYHRVQGEVRMVEPERVRDVRGGVLAEQMGLGKTMEMIALILARPYQPESAGVAPLTPAKGGEAGQAPGEEKLRVVEEKWEEEGKEERKDDSPVLMPARKKVILVGPVKQEVSEDKNETADEKQEINGDKSERGEDVTSTAPVLHRMTAEVSPAPSAASSPSPSRLMSPPLSSTFSPLRSPFSPPPFPTSSTPSSSLSSSSSRPRPPSSPIMVNPLSFKPEVKGTLIITPISIVYQWKSEIEKHSPSLRVLIYTTDLRLTLFPTIPSTPLDPSSPPPPPPSTLLPLSEYDVVLTSYSVLAQQVNYSQSPPYNLRHAKLYSVPLSPLLEVHWHRVGLDEAQRVQNGVSNSARMAQRVQATHRWAVTGTPIGLHGLNDVYGLILFLGLAPYSTPSVWLRTMTVENEEGMRRLIALLRRTMWRHSKRHVQSQIALPPLHTHTHFLRFNEVEYEAYRRFEMDERGKLYFQLAKNSLPDGDHVKRIDALRQMCDHPQVLASGLLASKAGKRFDTMEVLGRKLLQKAKDEVSEKEREVCRLLNIIGLLLKRHGRSDDSERYLKESWTIYDRGVVDAKAGDAEHAALKAKEEKEVGQVEVKAKGDQDRGGQFDTEATIVTPNTQARMWRFIELVSCWHLRDLYRARMRSIRTSYSPSPSLLSQLTSHISAENALAALQLDVDDLTKKLDRAADELLDLLEMQHNNAMDFIVSMTEEVLPLWSTNPEPDVAEVLRAWEASQPEMAAFFRSQTFRHARALMKKYRRQEKYVEAICNYFDLQRLVLKLEQLIKVRAENPHTCVMKQYVHQQMMRAYYPADVQQAIDRQLFKAHKARSKEWATVQKKLLDLATDEEREELRNIDWDDEQMAAHYDARWSHMRAQHHTLLTLVDLCKGVNNAERLKALREKAKEFLFRQAADPPPKFGQEAIPLKAILGEEETAMGRAREERELKSEDEEGEGEERKNGKEEKEERGGRGVGGHDGGEGRAMDESLLAPEELQAELSVMQKQVAALRVEAHQRQRKVKYLQNKLANIMSASTSSTTSSSTSSSSSSFSAGVAHEQCPICNRTVVRPVITTCGHVYCLSCLQQWMSSGTCPTCRQELTRDDVVEMPQNHLTRSPTEEDDDDLLRADDDEEGSVHTVTASSSYSASPSVGCEDVRIPSLAELGSLPWAGEGKWGTKVDCIIRHLLWLRRHHPHTKSLVYSQFPRMLALFAQALDQAGIPYLELSGSTHSAAHTLNRFQTQSERPVLLLSLRRDSSGLTLVSASHVFLFEPSLERSVELQAINRIHRIGQRKVCHVHRFVMQQSVEAKIDKQVHGGGGRGGPQPGKKRRRSSRAMVDREERKDGGVKEEEGEEGDRVDMAGAMEVDERKEGDDDGEDDHVADAGLSQKRKEALPTELLLDFLDLQQRTAA